MILFHKLKCHFPFTGSSGVLMGVMGFRAMKSGKFMPAGLVASLRYGFSQRLIHTQYEANLLECYFISNSLFFPFSLQFADGVETQCKDVEKLMCLIWGNV